MRLLRASSLLLLDKDQPLFFIFFNLLIPIALVGLDMADELRTLGEQTVQDLKTWHYNEVDEASLALRDVSGASVHELAHVEFVLFFEVSLMEEFHK